MNSMNTNRRNKMRSLIIYLFGIFLFVGCSTFTTKTHGVKVSIGMDKDYSFSLFENSNSEEEVKCDKNGDEIEKPYLIVSGSTGSTDAVGEPLTISSIGTITKVSGNKTWDGKIEINATDPTKINYTKSSGFVGEISFQYKVTDGLSIVGNTATITVVDKTDPILRLTYDNIYKYSVYPITAVLVGGEYKELGGTVVDNLDGEIAWQDSFIEEVIYHGGVDQENEETYQIGQSLSDIDTSVPGVYEIHYIAFDSSGNLDVHIRDVYVLSPTGDYDEDGISNADELNGRDMPLTLFNYYQSVSKISLSDTPDMHKIRTNPMDADSDGDGLEDKQELEDKFTDPLDPDTDSDGFWDSSDDTLSFPTTSYDNSTIEAENEGISHTNSENIVQEAPVMPNVPAKKSDEDEKVEEGSGDLNFELDEYE